MRGQVGKGRQKRTYHDEIEDVQKKSRSRVALADAMRVYENIDACWMKRKICASIVANRKI